MPTVLHDWSEEATAELEGAIASGAGIADVAGKNGFPSETAIYRRMHSDAAFASRIARAREAQQDREADYMIALADSATPEDHQVVKLRIWARQWRASKLAPRKYGDRLQHANDPVDPMPEPMTPERMVELARQLTEAKGRK